MGQPRPVERFSTMNRRDAPLNSSVKQPALKPGRRPRLTATCLPAVGLALVVLARLAVVSRMPSSSSYATQGPAGGSKNDGTADDGDSSAQETSSPQGRRDSSIHTMQGAAPVAPGEEECRSIQHGHGKDVPIRDLVDKALKEAEGRGLFVTQAGTKRYGWDGPGSLPRAGSKHPWALQKRLLPRSNATFLDLWPHRSHCAAVGNSGHLKLKEFGRNIDSHDFVLRLNQGPTRSYEKWVGQRTAARLINYSWLRKYTDMVMEAKERQSGRGLLSSGSPGGEQDLTQRGRQPLASPLLERLSQSKAWRLGHQGQQKQMQSPQHGLPDQGKVQGDHHKASVGPKSLTGKGMEVPLEKHVALLFRWQTGNTAKEAMEMVQTLTGARPDVKVLIISGSFRAAVRSLMGRYNRRLQCAGVKPEGGDVPSSGLLAIFMLLHLCRETTLYGFGAAASKGRSIPYHYYTNLGERTWSSKASIHSFNTEQRLIEGLARLGYVKMCNDKSSRQCGFQSSRAQ